MPKPRATITHHGFRPGPFEFKELDSLEIAAWCPDSGVSTLAAQSLPQQVHLTLKVKGLRVPFVVRFKSPDTLGFLIEELARYRQFVWPKAEPLDLKGEQNDRD